MRLPRDSIFLSYRRRDSNVLAFMIAKRLQARFGPSCVFFDHESINPGAGWRSRIDGALRRSRVVIAVIGPHWGEELRDRMKPGDRPGEDWVRHELETALQRGLPVVSLLVDDAQMPPRDEFGPGLAALPEHQSFRLRTGPELERDLDALIAASPRLSPLEDPTGSTVGASGSPSLWPHSASRIGFTDTVEIVSATARGASWSKYSGQPITAPRAQH